MHAVPSFLRSEFVCNVAAATGVETSHNVEVLETVAAEVEARLRDVIQVRPLCPNCAFTPLCVHFVSASTCSL